MRVRVFAVVGVVVLLSGAAAAGACPPGGTGGSATITGSFADVCRDFVGQSTREISSVEVHYADGRFVRTRPGGRDVSIDGAAGDEIALVVVKSGTTRARFTCTPSSSPPMAVLQVRGPLQDDWSDEPVFCVGTDFPDPTVCQTARFRGTTSSDPDGDIATWSIAFGDGTSASGSWSTDPPADVTHTYAADGFYDAVLTVTDSAGQASTDTISVSMDTDGAD